MKFLFSALALLLTAACLHAKTVTVSFEARIKSMNDPLQIFGDKLHQGSLINGKFTYDPDLKHSDGEDVIANYYFEVPKYGMTLNIANTLIQSTPGEGYSMGIMNDFSNVPDLQPWDQFSVSSEQMTPSDPRLDWPAALIQGWDTNGKLLPSTDIPSEFPDLKSFDTCAFTLFNCPVTINAKITKVSMDDSLFIPIIHILPASGDILQTQNIDPAIWIDDVKPGAVKIEKILLDDVDVTERYLYASRTGKLAGDQASAIWQLTSLKPSPGSHVFKVKVGFKDKASSWAEVRWNILETQLGKGEGRISERKIPDRVPHRQSL